MKKILLFIWIVGFCFVGFSQTEQAEMSTMSPKNTIEPIKDRLLIDVFHSFWLGVPKGVNVNTIHPGFNISALWDFKQKKEGLFSFGLGLGTTFYTQYSNAQLSQDADQIMRYHIYQINDSVYKKNKLNCLNFNVPLEFRIRHQSGFKFTLGVRIGLIAELSRRYKGNNPNGDGTQINIKSFEIYNKQKYHFDVYMRTGWKYVSVYYCWQLTSFFVQGEGPKITPMSLGFTWNLF
jgi:hypothetical protein